MFNPPDTPRGLLCPKCRYDLRGTMGDWSDRCPLRGICPECGLEFEWANMIAARRKGLLWVGDVLADWLGLSRQKTRNFMRRLKYRLSHKA